MILTSPKKITISFLFVLALLACATTVRAQSVQNGLSLSVTPTLFEMSASPDQEWSSSVKIINNNAYELTVYASVVNFAPQGETGQGKFLPVFEEVTNGATLAEWITITQEPIVIPPEESVAVPFFVHVPEDAAPGGHFAAILVGTRPPESEAKLSVQTSQIVTSLFFVRIAGDVIEQGNIREFTVVRSFVSTPKAEFQVRFENKGNVHLQPQGEITITNMWGKERGVIPINHKTHFGNVLPDSIRKFEFAWSGEPSLTDIGRYKASLALAYGTDNRKFVTQQAYFYVVPVKALLVVLGSIVLFILFASWAIKAYVRRMLALAGIEPAHHQSRSFMRDGDVRIVKRASIQSPVRSGVTDLKNRLSNSFAATDKLKALGGFIISYRVFFISLLVLVIAGAAAWFFISEVTSEHRDYEVTIDNAGVETTLSSEEILYEEAHRQTQTTKRATSTQLNQSFSLVLVNSSDVPGAAASLQSHLESLGYTVDDLQSDFKESKDRTVIVYDVSLQDAALELSRQLDNALLSAEPPGNTEALPSITVYIGNDHSSSYVLH